MAKRYGRNQKRAARETIASLEDAYDRELNLIAYQREQLHEYENWSERLNRAVPQYSALRKNVPVVTMSHDPGDSTYLSTMPKFDPFVNPSDPVPDYMSAIEKIRMNVARVEARRDDYNHALRFELRVGSIPSKQVMYAISDEMLRAKDYDDMEHFVGREVSRNMIQHLKNA